MDLILQADFRLMTLPQDLANAIVGALPQEQQAAGASRSAYLAASENKRPSLPMMRPGSPSRTITAVLIWLPVTTWTLVKPLKFDFSYWFKGAFKRGIVPGLIALSFGLALEPLVQPESLPELVVAIPVVSVYLPSILLFCLNQDERHQVKQLAARFLVQRSNNLCLRIKERDWQESA